MAAAHLFSKKKKQSANRIFNQPLRARWIWCWIMTFLILDRSSICMISQAQTLFFIIVTARETKSNQAGSVLLYSSHFWMQTSYYLWTEGTHITAAHFKTIHERHFLIQSKSLSKEKNVRKEKAMAFLMLISYSLWKEGIHTQYS